MAELFKEELQSYISTKSREELEKVLYDLIYFAKVSEEVNYYPTDKGRLRLYYENSGDAVFPSDELLGEEDY